jgi:hypothetical protein
MVLFYHAAVGSEAACSNVTFSGIRLTVFALIVPYSAKVP